jgi:general secretion pathway protein I
MKSFMALTQRRWRYPSGDAGFTLFEALAALAVLAASMAAIGESFRSSLQTVRQLEDRVTLVGAGEVMLSELPDRASTSGESPSGGIGETRWRIDSQPYPSLTSKALWTPVSIALTIRTRTGQMLRLDTVRLSLSPRSGG